MLLFNVTIFSCSETMGDHLDLKYSGSDGTELLLARCNRFNSQSYNVRKHNIISPVTPLLKANQPRWPTADVGCQLLLLQPTAYVTNQS